MIATQERLFAAPPLRRPAYVPVVKDLDGELGALADLTPTVISQVVPVVELRPGAAPTTLRANIAGIKRACGLDVPVLLTLVAGGDDHERVAALRCAYREARAVGLRWYPVGEPGGRRESVLVREAAAERSAGALRVSVNSATEALAVIVAAAREWPLPTTDTFLLLDLGVITDRQSSISIEKLMRDLVSSIPNVTSWHTIAIGGCAFPSSLSEVPVDGRDTYPRIEWEAYRRLARRAKLLSRFPAFLDYTVVKPTQRKPTTGRIKVAANIRYTFGADTVVLKGRFLAKDERQEPFRQRLQAFASSYEYRGRTFSRGDEWLYSVAFDGRTVGTSADWRRADVCHHVTTVVEQVAALTGEAGVSKVG